MFVVLKYARKRTFTFVKSFLFLSLYIYICAREERIIQVYALYL
jgi:hypothetical protein